MGPASAMVVAHSVTLSQVSTEVIDEWQSLVPVISAAIAVLALLVAMSNRRTTKKALRLSEIQEERRAARLDLSLMEGATWRPKGKSHRWIVAKVLAVNPTDRDGSLVWADLHVTYMTPVGDNIMIKVPHSVPVDLLIEGIAAMEMPARLPANGAVSGWLTFKLDDGLVPPGTVERYDVAVHDSRGLVEKVQTWILRRITDGQSPEEKGSDS